MTAAERPVAPLPPAPRTSRHAPVGDRPAVWSRTPLAAAVCLVSFALFWIAQRAADVSMVDLMVYRAEGLAVRTGEALYDLRVTEARLPNTYPPFAALLFTPLTLVGVPALRTLATTGNLLLLVAFAYLSLRLVRPSATGRATLAPALWCAAAAVWCEPVWTTLRYGQVNLLLAVLVLADLTRRPGRSWAGAGIGLAAGIKLTPALFAVVLTVAGLLRRRRRRAAGVHPGPVLAEPLLRRAAVAAGVFAGTVLTGLLVLPGDSVRYWTSTFYAADRAGRAEDTANQSLRGVAARLLHDPDPAPWWAAALVVAVCGTAVAVAALLADRTAPAVLACAVTALLISPVSWTHHWVWCVPLVLLLGSHAARGAGCRNRRTRGLRGAAATGTALAFCSYLPWWVPHGEPHRPELHQNWGEMACSALYTAVGTVFLAAAWYGLRRSRRSRSA